jgi:hypothetical protein
MPRSQVRLFQAVNTGSAGASPAMSAKRELFAGYELFEIGACCQRSAGEGARAPSIGRLPPKTIFLARLNHQLGPAITLEQSAKS